MAPSAYWCRGEAVGAVVGVDAGVVTVVAASSSSMSTTPDSRATITLLPDIRIEVTPPALVLSSYTHWQDKMVMSQRMVTSPHSIASPTIDIHVFCCNK